MVSSAQSAWHSVSSAQSAQHSWRADEPRWFPLMRRAAGDAVAGRLQLGFDWDFNARSLLRLKLAALEGVLAQRVEVLCSLAPVPASQALAWLQLPAAPGVRHRAAVPPIFDTYGSAIALRGRAAARLSADIACQHARALFKSVFLVFHAPTHGLCALRSALALPEVPVVSVILNATKAHEGWGRAPEAAHSCGGQHKKRAPGSGGILGTAWEVQRKGQSSLSVAKIAR